MLPASSHEQPQPHLGGPVINLGAQKGINIKNFATRRDPWPHKFFVFGASFPFKIQEEGLRKEFRGGGVLGAPNFFMLNFFARLFFYTLRLTGKQNVQFGEWKASSKSSCITFFWSRQDVPTQSRDIPPVPCLRQQTKACCIKVFVRDITVSSGNYQKNYFQAKVLGVKFPGPFFFFAGNLLH